MDKQVSQGSVEYDRINSRLEFAERLLQGIASSTHELLTSLDFKESILKALAILGQATRVDRVYIFRQHYNEHKQPLVSQEWEWVTQGVLPQINNPNLQNIPIQDLFPRWFSTFSAGDSIAGLVQDFPEAEQSILEAQKILSIVAVPIQIHQTVWGFMGLDDCSNGHEWSGSEIAVLKTLANTFGGAISRNTIEKQLLDANQDLLDKQFKLSQEKVKADRATQAKQVFLDNISHELKTPLNGILGYSQILQKSEQISPENQYGIDRIYQSAMHLNLLVTNLLDVTDLESKDLGIDIQKVDLQKLLEDLFAIASINSEAKNIFFQIETPEIIPQFIWTDETRLKQVLLNLINNGIKFTHQGSVVLRLMNLAEQHHSEPLNGGMTYRSFLRFSVIDTGIGVSEDDKQQIFSLFSKASSETNQSEGAGLGLYISQKILIAFGSEIQFKSQRQRGSEFFFDIALECLGSVVSKNGQSSNLRGNRSSSALLQELKSSPIPPSSDLELLMHLTQVGKLNKVIAVVKELQLKNPEMLPFCETVKSMAKKYKVEEIELFLSSILSSESRL